ncbi:FERM, ARHGEF and pleckstrin domain-containing protein 2 [Schistosoma japonicum]|nr:FERM, ARHGEF and pleckstrin domain-containing protein 2 [Schistosoma japonicum]
MPCWLDHNKTIIRQYSSSQDFIYRFSVKFYTPHPNLLEEAYTRYLFALQIKRDLVTGTLLCSENTAALLASYIVQAEIGDFIKEEHRTISYLKSLKLLYEPNDERLRRVREFHKSHIGLSPTEADFALLDTARKIEFYGVRLHFARDHEGLALNLAVTHLGLLVFKNLIKINTFSWAKIRKLSFKRKRFLVKLHPDTYDTIEFIFDSRDECKQFWKKSIEHHTFFRCTYLDRKLQKRSRLASSGSSFRYTRRTEQELQEYVQRNCEKRTQFERPSAARQTSLSKTNEPTYSTRKLNSVSLTLRSSSADRRNFMSGNINGSFSGTFGKQPALKRAQSMGVNAMSRNQQEVDGSSTNVHLPITTLPTSGYSTMSESVTGSGRSSHPKNIEDLEEHESNDLQSSPKNELERRMTGDWSGDNQAKQPEEDVSSRAWKSEAGSPGQSAVASLCKLNLELDAFLSSRDDQISLSDRQNHGESEGMEEDAANRQSSNKSTQFVDLLHDGSLRGYLFSSTPSFDQNNERLPDLSSFKPSEHQLNDYSTSRSFNLIETPIFDSGDHPSWSLSLTSKIMSSHPDSLHRSEFSQPPPKPRRASQVLTTREEDSLTLTSEPIQFERNTIMEPSLGEIIQLHMDRAKLINPISTSTSVLLESPGPMLNISTNNNTVDSTYVSNITTTNQSGSRPYEAALILPTVTQLGLEINLDKELSFLRTTSVLSITTNNTTSSTASVCNNLPILDETSTIFDNNTSKTMNLSVFPNLSIKPQTISSSITIPPFTASISLITSSPTSTTFVTYPTSVTTTKGTYSLLGDEQMLSPDHSILYDFLPHDDAFSVTLNDISILKSTETREKVETDSQLPRSETESSRVQLSDFLQTFGLTSSSNEPIDLVKSIIKPTENESYGCLFLDDLVSKSPQFSTTSTTQTTACDTSAVSVTITTTNAYPAKTKSHLATTLSEESKTHNSLFSHFNASTSHFSVGSEPVHVASLDQWSSSSSESTTGVIIRSDLASHTSPTCHHSVPCINSVNPMLQHSLACPHALKSMHLGQVSNYSHPSEVDVKSTNFMTDYKIMNNVKNVTSHNNVVKTKHHKHLQNHEHICSHGHHLSNSIPNNIHLTELEEAVPSASNHICNMITGDNIKRIHRKRSDSKKSEQMRRSKHIHHIHDQIDHVSSRNQDLIPLNDLETAAEMLEEVPYVVLRRPRSVDVKQYQLHLEHQRQKAAALAAATGGYPFHLYQTPAAHYPFTSRLPTSSRFSYGPYVQPPHFHGFGGNECNQSHYVDTPVTFGTLHKSEQSSKQKTHKSSNRSKHMSSKGDSDSCKGYSKRTHSRSRKETRLPATEEIDHFLKHDLKSNPYSSSNQITTNNLPTQTTSAYSHYRHHDHCLHKRSEVPSTGKADGIPGERKSKSSPPTNNVTTISTKTDLDNQDKNIEYDKNLAKGRETITSSSFLSTAVSSTTTTTGIAKPKSQYSDLHQPQPSTSMQNKKNKTVTPLITTETQQLKQILSLDGREENGESEMPYPVSVSAVKPVPKLKATSKSINRHPTHEHSQHPLPPPYWYYHGNEQQPQQFHHHHHHPACASLIGKRETSARSARDQTQPTIYGSEFLATNYPHIFTKSLKPHGVDKSELRVTSTKKKVTSKPLSLPSDQLKSKIVQDFVDNSKESEEKNVKQAKTLKVKSYSDERGRADMDPNETFEKLREDLRSAGFTVDTNSPYSSTTKSKDNKQSTHSYSVHPRTTIYLDSESEEEIVKNGKCTITEKFVEGPGTKESKAFKKQVEEWIEKSQAAYTKDDASNNTDIQILPKEDDHRMEINDVIDVDLDHSVEVKPHLSAKHHQTNVNHHSPRSHSPSLPLSCHSIEPESTDLSFCSNLSTSGSSYSMLSGHDYSLSTNCSCEHFQKHGYDDFILSSCTSSCEYSHHAHRFHHNYSSSVISPEKLKDVKNSQKELLSNLKSQERKLKQELAKHRALTEKLVKVKRYNEKLLTIENISLSNPILNTEKSKGNYVVDDDKHGVGVSTTAVICDDTTTNINSLLTTQSAINQGTHLSKEHKSSDDEKEEPRRHSQHPKNLSRLSSHTKSRSRSGHRSTSRRRLQKQTEHDQKQSTDIHKTTHAPKIKSSQILDTSINKEPKESPGDGINSVNPESSASQRKKERKDVKKQEPQKHRSKHVTHYKHHHDHHRHKHNELHESNEKTAITEKTSKVLSGLQESNRIKAEQSSLSTAFEDNKEPNIADNLLIITNKAALDYQDNEQSPMHKQSDIKLIPISSATTSLISITNQSEKQIHQSTPSHSTNSVDTTTVKCNLEVINEKQDNEQSSSSQSLSNDDDKQMTIRTQTSSNYENLDISTIGRKEEDESLQLVSDKTDELPPIPPTCPPPIVYTIPPVTDRIDESADIMVKQAIDLLDEVVAESTRCIDNDAQSRTLSSINRCLEYSSSEQVMLGDDNEYNGTRIPNILDNDENQSNIVATSDTNLHSGTVTQFIKEENKNEISDRPCSPCESTTSASEGSEDIEPFPPPPPAEVLAEVIEEEPSPNIDVVEEEDEEENDEDDGEEERRKSSSVSTVIEVYLPVTSVVSSMQSNDDYETTENKLAPSNEQVEKHAHISDEPNDDDTTISESVRSVENDEFTAEITPPPDCEKSKIKVTDESSLLDKTLKSNLPLTE